MVPWIPEPRTPFLPAPPSLLPHGYSKDKRGLSKQEGICSVMSEPLQPYGLYNPWNSPGQNTGVGSCSLLQKFSNAKCLGHKQEM